jgi:hypothetical protein
VVIAPQILAQRVPHQRFDHDVRQGRDRGNSGAIGLAGRGDDGTGNRPDRIYAHIEYFLDKKMTKREAM